MTATAAADNKPSHDLVAIYQLADHLDATLAMGEDLLAETLAVAPLARGDGNAAIIARQAALTEFARRVRTLELGMTARLLQARVRASTIVDVHPRFAPIIKLLIGSTAQLADAAARFGEGLGDISEFALASGPDVLSYLASRSVVGADAATQSALTALSISEDFVLMQTIHLGPLLDMVGQFLESLDLAFDLYGEQKAA